MFIEVADRIFVDRREWLQVNVTAIAGSRGVVLVDTTASAAEARTMLEELRPLCRSLGPVVGVVNTHQHFDHTFGNVVMREEYGVPIHATEVAAAGTVASGESAKARYRGRPHGEDVDATEIVPADRTFSRAAVIDLGDRLVELVHPGRGHTGGDLVARVPDADVVVAGDLLEESGPPAYGPDCFPLEWPATIETVLGLTGPGTVVVPGHGVPVDRSFVLDQHAGIVKVASILSDLGSRAASVADALALDDWPWPPSEIAIRRGLAQLSGISTQSAM